MANAVSRELSLTYGGITVDDTGDYHLVGKIEVERSYRRAVVSCRVLVQHDTEATFSTFCSDLEAEFRRPDKRLRVVRGTEDIDLNPATNTGLDAQPTITRLDDPAATRRSRLYHIRVEVGLPADESDGVNGDDGLDQAAVSVELLEDGRYVVEITGEYTALSGNRSYAQYLAEIEDYATTQLAVVDASASWEAPVKSARYRQRDDVTTFTHRYVERLLGDAAASPSSNVAAIRSPELAVLRIDSDEGGQSERGVTTLTGFAARYAATIDATETQDLKALYTGTIRPWILQHLRDVHGVEPYVVEERFTPDRQNNRVEANLTAVGVSGGSLLASVVISVDDVQTGKVITPVLNGDPYAADVQDGVALWLRTTTRTTYEISGGGSGGSARAGVGAGVGGESSPGALVGSGVAGGTTGGGIGVSLLGSTAGGLGLGGTRPGSPGVNLLAPGGSGGSGGGSGGAGRASVPRDEILVGRSESVQPLYRGIDTVLGTVRRTVVTRKRMVNVATRSAPSAPEGRPVTSGGTPGRRRSGGGAAPPNGG